MQAHCVDNHVIYHCFLLGSTFCYITQLYERGNYPLGLGRLMSSKQEKGL